MKQNNAPLRAVELMQKGLSDRDIAITVGRSEQWVRNIRRNTVIRKEPKF